MEIKFNRTGEECKALVKAIGEILEVKPVYKGAPSFAYDIDGFAIDRNGTLTFDDQTDGEVAEQLFEELKNRGFIFELPQDQLIIEVPKTDFTEAAIVNLERIFESKVDLIKKALGTDVLPIEQTEDIIRFPWFSAGVSSDEVKAYTHLITALCEMAKTHQRVNMSVKAVDNEKYAFRCFLLRLGFIGNEYKSERKILLAPLSGNSAFKGGAPKNSVEADSE